MNILRATCIVIVSLALASCASTSAPRSAFDPVGHASPTALQHVVLIKLNDPGEAAAMIADIDAAIANIPAVERYWRGSRFDVDRPEVKRDFDVGLIIEFRDAAAYDVYVHDPHHLDVVTRWMPRCASLTIYDVAAAANAPSTTRR
jgi:hypothetical protein